MTDQMESIIIENVTYTGNSHHVMLVAVLHRISSGNANLITLRSE